MQTRENQSAKRLVRKTVQKDSLEGGTERSKEWLDGKDTEDI